MNILEEMLGAAKLQQWHKVPRLKMATIFEEGEDIWQDLQKDGRLEVMK
jgi:hypothetical protein